MSVQVKSPSPEAENTQGHDVELLSDLGDATQLNGPSAEAPPIRKLKPLSWFFVVFSLLAALFLFALDNTIVANVQGKIIHTFGGIEKLPWISVAFALGAVATNLLWYVVARTLFLSILLTSKKIGDSYSLTLMGNHFS